MPQELRDQRDLVLDQSQYALVLTETKGNVIPYVGPTKTNLDTTDKPVYFDSKKRQFVRCSLEESIQNFPRAEEGCYMVLENPSKEGSHPPQGAGTVPALLEGRKINIPGPVTFPLYPGQVATIIQGHHLRSNQYLIVRVYNEDEANKNWSKTIIKPAQDSEEKAQKVKMANLTMGKLLIIKGTEASFYIPPTGIEVVPDENGKYVRDAMTLERLEYSILLDEDGNKEYKIGPDVVFPSPTQKFVEKEGKTKFRAIELNEISGIHIKVIADYKDGNKNYKAGDELFITGKDQSLYFPRPEHAIIRYGGKEIHFATAIPEGEARYILDRLTGKISKVMGPKMCLPDPRKEVLVKRILDQKTVELWYPGNTEALEVNEKLAEIVKNASGGKKRTTSYVATASKGLSARSLNATLGYGSDYDEDDMFAGDEIERRTAYTQPRTVTLDTKYEGVPRLNIWTGYAVMLVNQQGKRKVIQGPATILPEYDEYLEAMSLSTGKPKNTDKLLDTVYLRVKHNKVSDLIEDIETKDSCRVDIKVSYRVNFTAGDERKWFDVENYVKFLCDHMRSRIKNAAKKLTIEELYSNGYDFVRDTILGVKTEDKRPGFLFEENGMQIYDVEILSIELQDSDIEDLLIENQKKVVKQNLKLAERRREKQIIIEEEELEREIDSAKAETEKRKAKLQVEKVIDNFEITMTSIEKEKEAKLSQKDLDVKIKDINLGIERKQYDLDLQRNKDQQDLQLAKLKEEVKAHVEKAGAITPDFIAALEAFGDKAALQAACEAMAPLSILGGKNVAEVIQNMIGNTPLGDALSKVLGKKSS